MQEPQTPTVSLVTTDVDKESYSKTPDLTSLLNAGMGVIVVEDTADFPQECILVVKERSREAVFRLAVALIEDTVLPLVLMLAATLLF